MADLEFRIFRWSGLPCHIARHLASKRLRDFLGHQIDRPPGGRHYIVAHSHGGNIALYAMRDKELAERIDGIITLSTPFLVPRKRDLSLLGRVSIGRGTFVFFGIPLFLLALALLVWHLPFLTSSSQKVNPGVAAFLVLRKTTPPSIPS